MADGLTFECEGKVYLDSRWPGQVDSFARWPGSVATAGIGFGKQHAIHKHRYLSGGLSLVSGSRCLPERMQLSCGDQAAGARAWWPGPAEASWRRVDKTPHIERPSYLGQSNRARVRSSPDGLAAQGVEGGEQRPSGGAAGDG
jgi:hypothetical protein